MAASLDKYRPTYSSMDDQVILWLFALWSYLRKKPEQYVDRERTSPIVAAYIDNREDSGPGYDHLGP
jgi:hypothetical protein